MRRSLYIRRHPAELTSSITFIIIIASLACSSAPADSDISQSDMSERRTDDAVSGDQHDLADELADEHTSSSRELKGPLKVSACPETHDCDPWRRAKRTPELCRFPIALYTQKRAMMSESGAEELEVRWALLGRVNETAQARPPKSPRRLKGWTVLWHGVKRSEFLAGSHAERVKSVAKITVPKTRSKIKPKTKPKVGRGRSEPNSVSVMQPCRDFILIKRQSARSFNRVDAREREFDEDDVEESRFSFSTRLNRYIERVKPTPPKIKVRAR